MGPALLRTLLAEMAEDFNGADHDEVVTIGGKGHTIRITMNFRSEGEALSALVLVAE